VALRRRRRPQVAEYCLFLKHAHSGKYHDADYWRTQLLRHHFEPTLLCDDRSTAPLLGPPCMEEIRLHITRRHHSEIGTIHLPQPALVDRLRRLTSSL
jgi:hypothetical protein